MDMDSMSMIKFDDWLRCRSMDESWITVAQHDVTERDGWKADLFMTSILAPLDSDEALLANSRWLASNDFGTVEVGSDGEWIKVQAEDHIGKNEDVRIEPFTFQRIWYDTWPAEFELIQNFILFYNLHFNAEVNKYVAVDGAGDAKDVVRIENEEQHKKIEVRARFLRNYLAYRDRVLVRQHDNQIYSGIALANLGIKPFRGRRLNDPAYRFDLGVVEDDSTGKWLAIGLLNGKDLIRPHDECQDLLAFPKGDCKFIIGVDAQGRAIKEPPSRDNGPTHFLTPVFFKRDVLKKYHDSTKYDVSQSTVSCGAHWGVKINMNGDLVMVFLGDLASLPANEQPHWQNYNVQSEGAPPRDGSSDLGVL